MLIIREYSRAAEFYLPPDVRFLTCTSENGRTMCRMARGQTVRWLAEDNATEPEDIETSADLDCCFSLAHSTKNNDMFIRNR